jgi:hypothetical protein
MCTSRPVSTCPCWVAEGTDNTAGRLQGLCLAVQLVAEALDVVEAVGNDYVVAGEDALDSRVFLCARIFLSAGRVVDGARDTERLVVDDMDLEAGSGLVAGSGDLVVEVGFELDGACRLARRGVACGVCVSRKTRTAGGEANLI